MLIFNEVNVFESSTLESESESESSNLESESESESQTLESESESESLKNGLECDSSPSPSPESHISGYWYQQ